MKQVSDIGQILLLDGSIVGYLCWLLALVFVAQIAKAMLAPLRLAARLWSARYFVLLRPSKSGVIVFSLAALGLWSAREILTAQIQYLEQRYISPAYENTDTSQHVAAMYEMEMAKYLDPYEMDIVRRRTRETAAKIGSTPLSIYEVAYSECGMNPFVIRTDGVAAGWIQFTTAGLAGLTIQGQPATLDAVKDACRRRDTETIMDLTDQYLTSRAKGTILPRAVDVYTCVFAPGYVGAPNNQVLYEGWRNPAYYLNKGLDGYYTKEIGGRRQIFRSELACDGRITVADMDLALQSKKSRLIQNYNTFMQ